jgi:transcriptional regulator with XRE-family HTH domain
MRNLLRILGERFHTIRRRQGLTIQELSEQTGVSPTIISRVETNKRPQVSFDVVARLAYALQVSLDEVVREAHAEDIDEEPEPAGLVEGGA